MGHYTHNHYVPDIKARFERPSYRDLESMHQRIDALAPARGVMNGIIGALLFWGITVGVILAFGLLAGCSGGGGSEPVVTTLAPQDPPAEPPPSEPPPTTTPPPVTPPPVTQPPVVTPPPVTQPPPAPKFPTGIWHGSTKKEGRQTLGVVLETGELWFVVSVVGNPDWAGGLLHGKMTTSGSTWTMKNGLYWNWEHQYRARLNGSGTWLEHQRLLGEFQVQFDIPNPQPPLYENDAVDMIYDTRSTIKFDMAKAAGTYFGLYIPRQEVLFTIAADGTITGKTAFGCEFKGTAKANGPVAEGTITFLGDPCVNDRATVKGVIGFDSQTNQIIATGLSSDTNQGFVFIGQRQ